MEKSTISKTQGWKNSFFTLKWLGKKSDFLQKGWKILFFWEVWSPWYCM